MAGKVLHTVVETGEFAQRAQRRLTHEQRQLVINYLAANPNAGDVIPGTGGARKIRFAGRGRGKSGGFRVITFYAGPNLPVFLLSIFGKGEKSDLTQAERNELRGVLSELAAVYREGVRRHVQGR